jgi:hypothetical protein
MFEKFSIDVSPIYIEKRHERDCSQEERIIIVPSGLLTVSSKDSEFLWGLHDNEEYEKFLIELNKHASDTSRMNNPSLFANKVIDNREFGISYFPYKDINSSKSIMKIIEDKRLKDKSHFAPSSAL